MQVHELRNRAGTAIRFIPLGGIITAIEVADRTGRHDNIVLAFADLGQYASQTIYLGATITGRYANRIANARFVLDGNEYRLAPTDGTSCVHGGRIGFDKRVWSVEPSADDPGRAALLRYTSPDGEEGFPGKLDIAVRYTLSDNNSFRIDYSATTDAPTIVNLTNHAYFNLRGLPSGDILGHVLEIAADRYTPADDILIPTGEIAIVAGTPFDFRQPRAIGDRIRTPHPQIIAGRGYDLNYVLDGAFAALAFAARLYDPASGRIVELHTTEPGLQLYTGNLLHGTLIGAGGRLFRQSDGLCLEPHHYPDSPNRPNFPSPILRPGEMYRSSTVYRFYTDAD